MPKDDEVMQMAVPPTPGFPLASLLGLTTEETGRGSAAARLTVATEHLNPHGSVHGAVLFAMVDTAMGAATMSVLEEGLLCVAVDVQLRFCKAVFSGDLLATASVRQAGKRIVHLQAEIRDQDDRLVAFGSGSFAVIGIPVDTHQPV